MRERKINPTHNRHTFTLILLSVLMLITLRFPLLFVGDYYQWTGSLLLVMGLVVIAYAIWGLVYRRLRFLAALLVAITLVTTAINSIQFERSFVKDCSMEDPVSMKCTLVYVRDDWASFDGWVWYLTVEHFPLGIQTEYHPSDRFVPIDLLFDPLENHKSIG